MLTKDHQIHRGKKETTWISEGETILRSGKDHFQGNEMHTTQVGGANWYIYVSQTQCYVHVDQSWRKSVTDYSWGKSGTCIVDGKHM